MGQHHDPGEAIMNATTEPVAITEALRLVLAALVVVGVITIDAGAIEAIIAAVGALASIGLTMWTRQRVTPVVPDESQ